MALTQRGKELAARIRRDAVLEEMPKVYFVEDAFANRYRVGRTDWPGDQFELVSRADFEVFQKVYESLNMPLLNKTDED